MKNVNWFVVLIIDMWLCAALACRWSRNNDPISTAAFVTIVIGIGYFLHRLS